MICRRGAGACLSQSLICDGIVDCLNAEDELNCEDVTTVTPTTTVTSTTLPTRNICTKEQFTCSRCVLFEIEFIQSALTRNLLMLRVFQCVDQSDKCDRFRDCSDGTDEMSCSCADYLRGTGRSALICDDHIDCADYSDEVGCRK